MEFVIDENAYSESDKYIENLIKYAELDRIRFDRDMSENEVIEKLIWISKQKREIQLENNAFINKYIVPFEKGEMEITSEVHDFYKDMCTKLRNNVTGEYYDRGINARLVRLRTAYNHKIGDIGAYLHCLYYVSYFSMILSDHTGEQSAIEGREILDNLDEKYFEQEYSLNYFNIYDYLLESVYDPLDRKGCLKRLQTALKIIQERKPEIMNPEHPRHASVCYAVADASTQFVHDYKRNPDTYTEEDIEYVGRIEEMLTEIVEGNGCVFQEEAATIALQELRYFVGKYTVEELLNRLMELFSADTVDGNINVMMQLFKASSQYVEDMWLYANWPEQKKLEVTEDIYCRVMRGFEGLEKEIDSFFRVVNMCAFVTKYSKYLGYDRTKDQVLKATVYADKALYIHTRMVRQIAMILTEAILAENESYFEGVADYELKFIQKHPMIIKELMSQCSMFHDIGKFYCMDYVSNSSRNLTDDEFFVIKFHPQNFDKFFGRENDEEFLCIRDCARLHHLWHNGKGGYPLNLQHTKNRPMVDILSVADSIDAATDIIGRPYTSGKTIEDLIAEMETFRDTRYNGYIVDVLKKPGVKEKIQYTITVERKHINYEVMRQ